MLADVKPQTVIIPCTGSFSLAHVAREAGVGAAQIVAGDISLYSTALGMAIMEKDWRLEIKPTAKAEIADLVRPLMTDPISKAAAVLLAIRVFQYEREKPTYYHQHRQRELVQNAALYIQQLREQIQLLHDELHGLTYLPQDMWLTMEQYTGDPGVVNLINPPRYCLAPDERILTADLRWVPAGELSEGDELLAFDEEAGVSGRRHWKFATITHSSRQMAECVRVHLEDGTTVVCSADHPWLADRFGNAPGWRAWVQASHLNQAFRKSRSNGKSQHPPSHYVLRALRTWDDIRTYEAGWLAGMFDGEGTLGLRFESTSVTLTQVDGPIQDLVAARISEIGFNCGVYADKRIEGRKPSGAVEIRGGFPEHLRFLGSIRPERLLRNFRANWFDQRGIKSIEKVLVVDVEPIGMQEIQSISTSSRTYIGEGFMMHNTAGYDRMFKGIDSVFDWDVPEARQFTEKDYARLMEFLGCKPALSLMYYATDGPDPVEEQHWEAPWRSVFADRPGTIGMSAINWIVANRDPVGIEASRARINIGEAKFPLFDMAITEEVDIRAARLDKVTGDFYRDLWIHKLPGSTTEVYVGVFADGHLMSVVGLHLADLRRGKKIKKGEKLLEHCASVTFAFTCPHPIYGRLHKLTLMSIVSQWFWEDVLGSESWYELNGAPKHVKTTMLTPYAENKTARGIMTLDTREQQKDGSYKLTYSAAVIARNRVETVKAWLSKFADVAKKG